MKRIYRHVLASTRRAWRDAPVSSAAPSIRRYAWLSIAAALITITLKSGAYVLTGSVGLLSDALESGVNLVYAGHYATETVGVKALGEHLAEQFGLHCVFHDHPTGM